MGILEYHDVVINCMVDADIENVFSITVQKCVTKNPI